jgi:hypothetical protein
MIVGEARKCSNYKGWVINMRSVLKILAAPFALLFTVLAAVCFFLLAASNKIFGILSGLVLIGAVILFIQGETLGGALFVGGAFLVSPYGLPALAGKLSEGLASAGESLRRFVARSW